MTLTERWLEAVKELRAKYRSGSSPSTPEQFKKDLIQAIHENANHVVQLHEKSFGPEGIRRELTNDGTKLRTPFDQFHNKYARIFGALADYESTRKQEAWADFRQNARYLLFRTLTALGIGAVVLLVAFFAKVWELPVPFLLRGIQP